MIKNIFKKNRAIIGILIVLVMVVACYQMAFILKPGLISDRSSIQFRSDFILQHLDQWQIGWGWWMLAAICLLGFFTILLDFIPESSSKKLGYLLVGLGTIPDITAEILFAWVLPKAIILDSTLQSADLLEFTAFYLTGFLGNGLYSLGGLILTFGLLKNPTINRGLIYGGIPAWLFGLGLSYACINQSFLGSTICTGLAMVWSSLWFFVISLTVFRKTEVYREYSE